MLCAHISCGVKWAWRSSSHLNWGVFSWRGRGRTMEEDELAAVGWERGRIGGRQADSVSVNRIVFLHLRLGARWQLIISEKLHLHFQLNFNTNSASSVHHHSAWAAPYRHWHIVGPSVLVTALEKWEHLCKRASGWLIGLWEILVLHSGTAGTRACLIFFTSVKYIHTHETKQKWELQWTSGIRVQRIPPKRVCLCHGSLYLLFTVALFASGMWAG